MTEKASHEESKIVKVSGADPGFFLAGGAPLRNGVTDWRPNVNTWAGLFESGLTLTQD